MRKLFALILVFTLWFGFAPTANADDVANLTPCGENPAYIQKLKISATLQTIPTLVKLEPSVMLKLFVALKDTPI